MTVLSGIGLTLQNTFQDVVQCVTLPNSEFKKEYGECLNGALTPEEEIYSDRMVKAWTNFARTGYGMILIVILLPSFM